MSPVALAFGLESPFCPSIHPGGMMWLEKLSRVAEKQLVTPRGFHFIGDTQDIYTTVKVTVVVTIDVNFLFT